MIKNFLTVLITSWALLFTQLIIPNYSVAQASSLGDAIDKKVDGSNKDSDSKTGTSYEFSWDTEDEAEELGVTQQALTWITMIASVFMAPVIAPICAIKIDTFLVIGATLLVFIMEIVALTMFKGIADQELTVYENQKLDKQLEGVTSAITTTETNMQVTKMRYGASYAFGALYYVAGALAIIMSIIDIVRAASKCNIAAAACAAACAPTANACPRSSSCANTTYRYNPMSELFPKMFAKSVEDPTKDTNSFFELKMIDSRLTQSPNDASSYFLIEELMQENNHAIRSVSIDEVEPVMEITEFNNILNDNKVSNKLSEIIKLVGHDLSGLIIPKAMAANIMDAESEDEWKELGAMIGLAGATLTAFITMVVLMKKKVLSKVKINGWVRGALFFVFGSFGIAAGKVGQDVYDKLEDQKEAYENLKDKIMQLMKSQDSYGLDVQQNIVLAPSIPNLGSDNPSIVKLKNKTCTSKTNKQPSFFSQQSACSCKDGKCTTKPPEINFGKGFNAPALTSGINLASKGMTSVVNGDVQGAITASSEIGRNASNYKKIANKVKLLANKQLDKFKVPNQNFDEMEKGIVGEINDLTKQAWNSMDKSQKIGLLEYSGAKVPESMKEKSVTVVTDKDEVIKNNDKKVAVVNPKKGVKPKDFSLDGIFGEDDDVSSTDVDEALSKQDNRPEGVNGKTSKPDISERTRTSIFKIIETRYFKSAFPVFFEEVK
ncbi:MAG: hypothetical protein OEY33_02035 [Bdellovibrionales bacterium]|nr:hypothetical protein [Bdellovibrionales bacterium]